MTFVVNELPKAKADKRHIFEWLFEHTPAGAASWLGAYDLCLVRLESHATTFGQAHENQDLKIDVRQAFFRTKRGRIYRLLFHIDGEFVYVLRVRGPGQAPVQENDI